MKMRCPSCNGIDDYESSPDICKKCGRAVKLIRITQENREDKRRG